MKTTDTKTTTTQLHQNQEQQPFFKREAKGVFDQQGIFQQPHFFDQPNSYSATTVQPKLTIGQPNDKYEQEADATAEKVTQKIDNQYEGIPTKEELALDNKIQSKGNQTAEEENIQQKPIFESESDNASSDIQAKCDSCEAEEKTQQEEEATNAEQAQEESLQRKPIFESEAASDADVQAQTESAAPTPSDHSPIPNTPHSDSTSELEPKTEEQEEQDQIQRKPIFESEVEETPPATPNNRDDNDDNTDDIQKSESEPTIMPKGDKEKSHTTPEFDDQLQSSKGGGQPMPKKTQESMESAFGADFSNVNVHTGKDAQDMSKKYPCPGFHTW